MAIVVIILIITLIGAVTVIILRRRIAKEIKRAKHADKRFVDTMKILFRDENIELFVGDLRKNKLYKYINGEYKSIGMTPEEHAQLIHPDDKEKLRLLKERVLESKEDHIVTDFRHFNKEKRSYSHYEFVIAILERDEEGRVVKYVFSRKDCSKEKEIILSQQALINEFSLSLKLGKMSRWSHDLTSGRNKLIDSSGGEYEFGNEAIDHIKKGSKIGFLRYISKLIAGESDTSYVDIWVYSEYHKVDRFYRLRATVQSDADGAPLRIHGICKDITGEDKLHRELSELQKNIMMALEVGRVETWKYDCERKIFTVIHGKRLSNENHEGMSLKYFLEHIHPDDKEQILNDFKLIATKKRNQITNQYRFKTPNGWIWIDNAYVPILELGKVTSLLGVRREITRDIEYQKMLQKKILQAKEHEEDLLNILEHLPVPIAIKNLDTEEYIYGNRVGITHYGILIGKKASFTVLKSTLGKEIESIKSGGNYEAEETIQLEDGRVIETIVRSTVIEYKGKKHSLISRIDLTEHNRAKRDIKLLKTFMPTLKACTWYFDGRNNSFNIIHNMELERDIDGITTLSQLLEATYPDDKNLLIKRMTQIEGREPGNICAFELRMDLEKVGRYEWWEVNAVIEVYEENGEQYHLASGISININERKKSELEISALHKQSELILNNANSLLVYITDNYEIVWSNADTALNGHVKEIYQISETTCYGAKGYKEPCSNCPVKEAFCSQSTIEKEFYMGGDTWFKVTAIPVNPTENSTHSAILRVDDVSEYKKLIAELEATTAKAEEADRLKSAFLANMSHEIRTPLNAIVGFSDLLQYTDDVAEKEAHMKIIRTNNDLLLQLIGDILDLSKIESGAVQLTPERFDFSTFFNETYHTLKHRCEAVGIELQIENPYNLCMVTLDKNRCLQLLTNYLNNAIKFTEKGYIRMGYECKEDGLTLFVQDTGIGISTDKMDRLFHRFEKLDHFAQGTGLGLSICKAIAKTMDGKVWAESLEGEGSTFFAWIPCEAEITKLQKIRIPIEDKAYS